MNKHSQKGYTLVELMIVIVAISIMFFGIIVPFVVVKNNAIFTDAGMTSQLIKERPSVKEVVKIQRNLFSYSVVTVRMQDGTTATICLDSDIFANYEFVSCE